MLRVDIHKRLGTTLLDVTFGSGAGVTALFGPSGSGKSSVIKAIAGLTRLDAGRIVVGGTVLADDGRHTPPHRRRIGVVFQEARLLPHLSVRSNLRYGRLFTPKAERRIAEGPVIDTLGIGHLLTRRPATLSGGEQQRVILARALTQQTECLVLDEPTNHLDIKYQLQIMDIVKSLDLTVVAAVHDLNIAAMYCDRLVAIKDGQIVGMGTPRELLTEKFIYDMYEVRCRVDEDASGRINIVYLPQHWM